MSFSKSVVPRAYRLYCDFLGRAIAFAFPARLWYRVSRRISLLHEHLLHPLLTFSSFRNDYRRQLIAVWLTQSTLVQLEGTRRPFPIPTCASNITALLEARKDGKGVVVCSVHLPFSKLVLRALVESGETPTAVVAKESTLIKGRII